MFGHCFVIQYFKCVLLNCNHLDGEERAGCFTLIVFSDVLWLFVTVPCVGLQCVIVVFLIILTCFLTFDSKTMHGIQTFPCHLHIPLKL